MRLLVYTDLQADEGSERLFNNPAIPLQRWRVEEFYRVLGAVYTNERCDGVVDLGDTLDSRNSIAHPTIMAVMDGIEQFRGTRDVNLKLIGNHDQWSKSGDIHVGPMFRSVFHVVPGIQDFRKLVAVSYHPNEEELAKKIAAIEHPETKILFGHFSVLGCALNSGPSATGVPREILERFKVCLLGHVHMRQQVGKNVWYIGSPFQQDFGEAGDRKFVTVIDTESGALEWVPMEGFPEYRTVSLDQFERTFNPKSEDRWKVILRNYHEAERLYAHPYAGRCTPEYVYTPDGHADEVAVPGVGDWSLESAFKKFMDLVPPESKGVEISREDLLDVMKSVVKR